MPPCALQWKIRFGLDEIQPWFQLASVVWLRLVHHGKERKVIAVVSWAMLRTFDDVIVKHLDVPLFLWQCCWALKVLNARPARTQTRVKDVERRSMLFRTA